MLSPDEETYSAAMQGVIAQVTQMDQALLLPPTLHARVQATIAAMAPTAPFALAPPGAALVAQLAVLLDLEEAQAQRLLQAVAVAPGPPWRPSGLPEISLLPVAGGPRVAGATCYLVYGPVGGGLPLHRHRGEEWTLVLQGWVEEDTGHRWGPGDLLHRAPGSLHAFHAIGTTPCVCALVDAGGFDIVAAPQR